jgi:3' terminal RNA ribose 2'-O-methyltransferase Hen1
MLLTITTTRAPATELGFLLHKNPARPQSFDLSFGQAHVFYPQADEDRCTAALLLDVDPIALVRQRRGPAGAGGAFDQYVNDRPYVASSFTSVAIAQVFGSALAGRSRERPELAEAELPLTARLSVLPCRGGETLLRRLFEPLDYQVSAERHALDEASPPSTTSQWGGSRFYTVELTGHTRLRSLLSHLYVLVPVLDDDKHYWVGDDEVEKLLRHGADWLSGHPERQLIVDRYLRYRRPLTRAALSRLLEEGEQRADEAEQAHAREEEAVEERIGLNELRLRTVVDELHRCEAHRVLDLGCSTGNLLRRLWDDKFFEKIVGFDVSHRALEIAAERLRLDQAPAPKRARIELVQGSLTYRDRRLSGYDAAAVVEVIEHLDPPRLAAFERVLFEFARPTTVIVTTPNIEHNVRFANLPAGRLRHRDHRFEWTREQFRQWSEAIAARFGYRLRLAMIGPDDPEVGAPTQMGVFER